VWVLLARVVTHSCIPASGRWRILVRVKLETKRDVRSRRRGSTDKRASVKKDKQTSDKCFAPRQKADLAISKKQGMQALKALGSAQSTFSKWQSAVNL